VLCISIFSRPQRWAKFVLSRNDANYQRKKMNIRLQSHAIPFARNQPIYPADTIHAKQPTHCFNGVITDSKNVKSLNQTDKYVRVIDNAIEFESVDEKTRKEALNYFSSQEDQATLEKQSRNTKFYGGVAISILGVGLCIGSFFIFPVVAPLIPPIVAIAGIGLIALGIIIAKDNNSNIKTINNDIHSLKELRAQWEDPIEKIISQRKLGNFQHAFRDNLKGQVFHEQEVQRLWLFDFEKLLSTRQSLAEVMNENLLGQKAIEFAWDNTHLPEITIEGRQFTPPELASLVHKFDSCRTSYLNFQAAVNQEKTALVNQKNEIKKEIENLKSRWYFPSERLYQQNKESVRTLYEDCLRPYKQERTLALEIANRNHVPTTREGEIQQVERLFSSHPAVNAIQRAYESDLRMCRFLRTQSQLVVDSFFDQRLRQLDEAFNHSKMQLQEQQTAGNLQLKAIMDKILTNNDFPLEKESMPNLHHQVCLPNLAQDPSWGEVFGRTPRFQSSFNADVSELAWNHFWSGQGLGRYSSHPASSWSNLFQDNSQYPVNHRWFNLQNAHLHVPAHQARPRMFVQPVHVPSSSERAAPHRNTATPAGQRTDTVRQPQNLAAKEATKQERVTPGIRTPVNDHMGPTEKTNTNHERVPVGHRTHPAHVEVKREVHVPVGVRTHDTQAVKDEGARVPVGTRMASGSGRSSTR